MAQEPAKAFGYPAACNKAAYLVDAIVLAALLLNLSEHDAQIAAQSCHGAHRGAAARHLVAAHRVPPEDGIQSFAVTVPPAAVDPAAVDAFVRDRDGIVLEEDAEVLFPRQRKRRRRVRRVVERVRLERAHVRCREEKQYSLQVSAGYTDGSGAASYSAQRSGSAAHLEERITAVREEHTCIVAQPNNLLQVVQLLAVPIEAIECEWHFVILGAALLAEVIARARAHLDVREDNIVLEQELARVSIQLIRYAPDDRVAVPRHAKRAHEATCSVQVEVPGS